MYYIYGMEEIINSIKSTSELTMPINNLSNSSLRSAYHQFLNKNSIFDLPICVWDCIKYMDFDSFKRIAPSFCTEKEKFFATNSPLLIQRLSNGFFDEALLALKEQHREMFDLAQFVVKIILINQLASYTNGTTQDTIGLSSMDFKDNFGQQDFIELVVHQVTHMTLFIDDYSNEHMPSSNKAVMIDTELKYKLGGTQFPAYLAFHSYIVGVEVLAYRKKTTTLNFNGAYHGNTQRIIRVCKEFQKSLINRIDLFSPRGKSFIEKSVDLLSKMANQYEMMNVA